MICARWVQTEAGQVLAPMAQQPADLSGCEAVLLTGPDTGVMSVFAFPAPADAAAAWGWGFSLVVGSYLVGWSVGAVVNFLKR